MKCVKCDGKLRRIQFEDMEIDQCDTCAGFWFDSGELRRILGKKSIETLRSTARRSKSDDAKRGTCPRCRSEGKLVQVASLTGDIHIDTCAVCGGQWLDGGELEILRGEAGPLGSVAAFFRKLFR